MASHFKSSAMESGLQKTPLKLRYEMENDLFANFSIGPPLLDFSIHGLTGDVD